VDDPSLVDVAELARTLGTDLEGGLSGHEAATRLQAQGPNELRSLPPVAAWRRALAQLRDPLVYLLAAAAALAMAAWWFEGRGRHGVSGWPVDAIVIALIVILNGVLGHVQEAKAHDAVAALARMSAPTASVVRDGQAQRVPSADLVTGDLLVLAEGDAIAADARLVRAASLHVQESSLTGESAAVLKDPATLQGPAALGDRLNMVFKGTFVTQGSGHAVVVATGMATQMGSIAGMLAATTQQPTPLEKEIAHIGRMLGIAVLVIAVIVVGTILLISRPDSMAGVVGVLLLGVALAVAAVPEGLPAILSVVLALGVQRMARHNAIVKKLSSVETLGGTTVICTDKTGTLTAIGNDDRARHDGLWRIRHHGRGLCTDGQCNCRAPPAARPAAHAEQVVLLGGGSLAGNASLRQVAGGAWEMQGDPTEAAFLVAERKLGTTQRREQRFERIAKSRSPPSAR
jgi:Ca2+-transporting ATPase